MMNTTLQKILIGQILGDAHIEKIKANCRMTFSFGSPYLEYAEWIASILSEFCSASLYSVNVKTKGKNYTNYRLKTRTLPMFTELHDLFYYFNEKTGKYVKIVPLIIKDLMCPIVLAHFIMGDGNFMKDGRVRIFTNNYTYEECLILRDSILKNCHITCEVKFDRIGKNQEKQYILMFSKSELNKLQMLVKAYMHSSMLYRIGI